MTNLQTLSFTNRESFLAWRAEWREEYAELSANLRRSKMSCKEAFRANKLDAAARLQNNIRTLKSEAREMMELRKEATEQKNAQLAARETQAA
jgi:hypothetical protein